MEANAEPETPLDAALEKETIDSFTSYEQWCKAVETQLECEGEPSE